MILALYVYVKEKRVFRRSQSAKTTRRTQISGPFVNERDVFACVTLLSGNLTADGMFLTPGMSAVVFPGERAAFSGSAEVMVAWPRAGEETK